MLVDWNFEKRSIRVGTDTCTLSVAGEEIVKADVKDFCLHLRWCHGEWERWEELQGAPELASVKSTAQEKLDRAKVGTSKGKGKNK